MKHQLKYDNLPLKGRDTEIEALRSALQRVKQHQKPEVVFIGGSSGSGKTTLANTLKREASDCYFVTGKFDAFTVAPYSAFVDALSDLCDQVAKSPDLEVVKETLCEALGEEEAVIRKALPHVEKIIGKETFETPEPMCTESFAFSRLKISCRALIKSAMATGKTGTSGSAPKANKSGDVDSTQSSWEFPDVPGKTLVLVLDDLHWADQESWDLIRNISEDITLTRLLLIGVYRDNEVTATMADNMSALSTCCTFGNVFLHDLDVHQLNELVAAVLKTSTARTELLSAVIHTKTAGNPYFTLQFMQAAENKKLFTYSMQTFRWEWDLDKIRDDTDVADNIVDIFVAKIDYLPVDAKQALIIGSCLGAKFDALMVQLLLSKIELPDVTNSLTISRDQLFSFLDRASNEGIVNRQNESMVYRFVHDKIHQAFYSLVPQILNTEELHFKIGCILLEHRSEKCSTDVSLTFLAANQLNLGSNLIRSSDDRLELAKLNLAAAKAAIGAAAYRPATEYLDRGVNALQGDWWSNYDLKLELSTLLCKAEGCLGNFRKCHEVADDIIQNARTVEEMIPAFFVSVDALYAEGRWDECVEKGFKFVQQLGVKLPKRVTKLTVVMALIKVRKTLKGKTKEMLLSYPRSTNPSKSAAVRIISTLISVSFQTRRSNLVGALTFIGTQLLLKHGFTSEAGPLMGCYGIVLGFIGDIKGPEYGLISMKLAEESRAMVPRTWSIYYLGMGHWKNPLNKSMDGLLEGYRVGFEVGDTLHGFYCCYYYLQIFFFVGLKLSNLLKDMDSFSKEMKAYNMHTTLDMLGIHHQSVINLTSETELPNPTTLDGRAMTEATILNFGTSITIESVWFGKLLLGLYFNDHHVVQQCVDKLAFERGQDLDGHMHYVPVLLWAEACGSIMVIRHKNKRKYRKLVHRCIKTMTRWKAMGNVNCSHFLEHIYAEMAVLKKQSRDQVKVLYDAAIAAARKRGYTNTAALATERAALYLASVNDIDEASYYLEEAIKLYDDWGATAKILQLKREYSSLLRKSAAVESGPFSSCGSFNISTSHKSTSFKGSRRHSSTPLQIHNGGSLEFLLSANSSSGKLDTSQSSLLGKLNNSSWHDLESGGNEDVATHLPSSLLRSKIDEVNSGTDGGSDGAFSSTVSDPNFAERRL
jgi:predicted ATPase